MIFLISIVFIAQLVLLSNIVAWTISTDNKVLLLSKQIETDNKKLEKRLKAIVQISEDINHIIPYLEKKIMRKRNNLIIRSLNNIMQSTILLFFKPKYKKLLLGIKIGSGIIKDLAKK